MNLEVDAGPFPIEEVSDYFAQAINSLCSIEPQCHRLADRQSTRKSKWTDSSKTPSFSRVSKWRLNLKELRDENGRLRKLLGEKDYEIGYLRRIQEEERQAFIGTVSVTGLRWIPTKPGNTFYSGSNTVRGDAIATKMVELSKKNRELCSELESERAKLKKLSIKCKELETMVV